MKIIQGITLFEIYEKTKNEAEKGITETLIINGEFPIEELDKNSFLESNKKKAEEWQSYKCPPNLYFNHGEYISEKGYIFLIDELKRKSNSHRACLSLINMEDIITSGDDPLPSFMTMQVSFSQKESDKLLVVVYYRALEVSEFFKINIAEICLIIQKIIEEFTSIKKFELTIIAFKAQVMNNFHCLEKSELDTTTPHTLSKCVFTKDKNTLIRLLENKKEREESIIELTGMKTLYSILEEEKSNTKEKVLKVLKAMEDLKEKRKKTSEAIKLEKYTKEIRKRIDILIKEIEGWT